MKKTALSSLVLAILLVFAAVSGCDIYLPDLGGEHQHCFPANTTPRCNDGLICNNNNTCTRPDGGLDGGDGLPDAGDDGGSADETGADNAPDNGDILPDGGDQKPCQNPVDCLPGGWCFGGFCQPCTDSDDHHCGPNCIDCTPQNMWCSNGACTIGCNAGQKRCNVNIIQTCINGVWVDGTNCQDLGEVCQDGSCVSCRPNCTGKPCGAEDSCGGFCLNCGQGQWCGNVIGTYQCMPCTVDQHCGQSCANCTLNLGTATPHDCACLENPGVCTAACRSDYCNIPGNACWRVPGTGLAQCADSSSFHSSCGNFGIAGDSNCTNMRFCGQDAQYGGLRCLSCNNGDLVIDTLSGLKWESVPLAAISSEQEAVLACQTANYDNLFWRLPTFRELADLVEFGSFQLPRLSACFNVGALSDKYCWTSSPTVTAGSFAIQFSGPKIGDLSPGSVGYALCVTPNTLPGIEDSNRFLTYSFGQVFDQATGLIWIVTNATNTGSWEDALSTCQGLGVGAPGGWRLPNINELRSLMAPDGSVPMPNRTWPLRKQYWSSTSYTLDVTDASKAWTLDAATAFIQPTDKMTPLASILCVRGGLNPPGQFCPPP